MLAIRLSPEIEKRLNRLAKATGRTKTFYVREAIIKPEFRSIAKQAGQTQGHYRSHRSSLSENLIDGLPRYAKRFG